MDSSSPPRARLKLPWITVVIAVLAVAIQASDPWQTELVFERAKILQGEIWRLWTGNLVHFGVSHLGWNLAVLAVAGTWLERTVPLAARWFLLLGPGLIGLALLALDPGLAYYGGLSGVAAGALALLAATQISRHPSDRWFWWAVLALLAAKIAVESVGGRPLLADFSRSGARPVPLAHVAGVAAGLGVWARTRRI